MRPLDIVVCIKPVPDPRGWKKLKLDPETMLLSRSEIPAVMNSLDRNAIEQALQIKSQVGGTVTAVTMAPPEGEQQLLEALAMGCDRAVLLSDRTLAGADTLATARCLAAAIARLDRFDLVCCGAFSLDGSTSQVGPQLAEVLGIPDVTYVRRLDLAEDGLRATCQFDEEDVDYECPLPALATFSREANFPRLPTMSGIMTAGRTTITRWTAADLGLEPGVVGLAGSPTRMLNVFTPTVGRKGEVIQGTPGEVARRLVTHLREERVLGQSARRPGEHS
jgi:electron transfer flavoprotein beta subunit